MNLFALCLWLLCGVCGEIIQRRAQRKEGVPSGSPWLAFPINGLFGPIALIGCLLAYP